MSNAADTSVKEQLKKLIALQEVDSQKYDLNQEIIEKPVEVDALKVAFEAKKARFNELEAKVKAVQLDRNQKELELKTKEEAIQKSDAQLSMIKTNKEYQAKLIEIETLKADKERIEESILESFDNVDELTAELDKEKEFLSGEEANYLEEKQKVDALVAELKVKVEEIEAKSKELQGGIDRTILAFYQRVLEARGGIAIVPVRDQSCSGCYMNVPPQTINAIKMNKDFVKCEMCQRILYLETEL